ncbi:MAG: DinB superfamily protein [Phycisphaerales bacterium]|nr:DinB superfamily protein [Phycisphaerales bacterium]
MTTNECLLFPYARSSFILNGMTLDLKGDDWLHTAVDESNCAAWIIGHLIVVEHWAMSHITEATPFKVDEAFKATFGKGSMPTPKTDYGDISRLMPMWTMQRTRMVELVTALPAADFDKPIEHPTFKNIGQLVALIPVHTSLHTGQISTIRRSLGKPALF